MRSPVGWSHILTALIYVWKLLNNQPSLQPHPFQLEHKAAPKPPPFFTCPVISVFVQWRPSQDFIQPSVGVRVKSKSCLLSSWVPRALLSAPHRRLDLAPCDRLLSTRRSGEAFSCPGKANDVPLLSQSNRSQIYRLISIIADKSISCIIVSLVLRYYQTHQENNYKPETCGPLSKRFYYWSYKIKPLKWH